MRSSAAALASRYGELKMPIIIMAGTEDRIGNFESQSEHLDEVLGPSTLVSFQGAGHMIHHLVPERVVQAIDLAASCSGLAENNQLTPMQPGTVDAEPQPEAT